MLEYLNPIQTELIYKKSLRFFSLLAFSILFYYSSSAQIQVTPATDDPYDPINLIENVFLGDGVEILNIKYDGSPVATGVFSNAMGDVNLERGIVISTGEVNKVAAANDIIEDSSSSSGDGVFDSDLDALVTASIRDVAVYEITFRPISDNLQFRYVFASEEYPEFVCGEFNDVFGFFISGPNPDGGQYMSKNIALVPDPNDPTGLTFTDFPVYTNSVNPGQIGGSPALEPEDTCQKDRESLDYSQYYNDNSSSNSMAFDGYTDVFVAQAKVEPCQEYTIKLAIGDVADPSFNSAVFLEAKSFSSPTLKVSREDDLTVDGSISEGCDIAIFKFKLPSIATRDTFIEYEIVSSPDFNIADQGVDYNLSPSTTQLVINRGDDEVELEIEAFLDNIAEPAESILLAYQKNFCTRDTIEIILRDKIIEEFELEEPVGAYCTDGYTVQAEPPGGAVEALDPFRSNQLIDIAKADSSYSDIIKVSGVSPAVLTSGLLSKICIDELEHRVPEDLDIFITSPGGRVLELSTDNGSIGSNPTVLDRFSNTCFTINATQNINNGNALAGQPFAGNPTYTGEFLPEGDWDDLLSGEDNVNGDWKLTIRDDSGSGGGDNSSDGALRGWSLHFNAPYEVSYRWSTLPDVQDNDGTISDTDILNTTFTPTETRTYFLDANDSYGCTFSSQITVTPGEQVLPPDSLKCKITTSNLITVSWQLVDMPSAIEVVITQDTSSIVESDWENIATNSEQSFPGLESETTYFIGVRSVGMGCVGDAVFISCTTEGCPQPQISTLTEDPSSCREDGQIIVVPAGSGPFTVELDGVESATGAYMDLTAGSYLVKVTDRTGCSDTLTVDLQKSQFGASIVPVRGIDCFGEETGVLNAFPVDGLPSNFEWSHGPSGMNEFSVGNLRADQYKVTITNLEDGCEAVDSIVLTQPTELRITSLSTTKELTCKDSNDGELSVLVEGGVAPYTYEWSDAMMQSGSIAVGLTAGDYSVIVTDSLGCSTLPIIGTVAANVGFSFVRETIVAPKCVDSNDGSFSYVDDPDLSWEWTNTAGEIVASSNASNALASGKYFIKMTDGNGCVQLDSVEIPAAVPFFIDSFLVDSTSCFDSSTGSISLTVSGGTGQYESFEWDKNGEIFTGTFVNDSTETITNLNRGFYNIRVSDTNGCLADTTLLVDSPPEIELVSTMIDTACFQESNGSIEPTIIGGVPNATDPGYAYRWTSPTGYFSLDQNPTGMSGGVYDVLITDGIGCEALKTVNVPENQEIDITLDAANITCKGDASGSISVLLGGGAGGFNYEWTSDGVLLANTDRILDNLEPSTYAVTVTDKLGCIADTSYQLLEPQLAFVVSLTQDTICSEALGGFEDGVLSVTPRGGEAPYRYQWSDGSGEPTLQDVGGDYMVTVSDEAGCDTIINASIVEINTFEITSITGEAPKCNSRDLGNSSSGRATIDLSDINYQFDELRIDSVEWSEFPDQDSLTVEGLTSGVEYFVTLTDQFGCKTFESITLQDPPKFQIETDTIIGVSCFGESDGTIRINTINGEGPFDYAWGASTNFETVQSPMNLRKGEHEVTVTDVNGCIDQKTFEIEEPNQLVVEGRGVNTLCFEETNGRVVLLVSGGTPEYKYAWPDGSTEESLLDLGVGAYSVTVTDANDCTVTEEVEVNGPTEPLQIALEVIEPKCPGTNTGLIEVTATGGNGSYLYSYDGVEFIQNPTLVGLVDGAYTITVRDRNGCATSKDTVITNQEALNLFIGRDTIIPGGDNIFVGTDLRRGDVPIGEEMLMYDWSINPPEANFASFDSFIEILELTETAIVTLTVTDSLGCTVSAIRKIDVESILNNQVMVPTGFTPNGDGANDVLRVLGRDGVTINSFNVYSRWGELVYSDSEFVLDLDDENKGWNGNFKGKAMNPGTFVWVLEATFEDGFQAVYKGNTQLLR